MEVYFKDIREVITRSLSETKNKVCIAVSWFTNEEIFNSIMSLIDKGVDISIIILDDYINNGPFGLDFQKFIDKGGVLYYSTNEKPVHNKFCIIDDSKVLTGSYNWTYNAEYKNHENEIIINDMALVLKYSDEFNKIISSLKPVVVSKIYTEEPVIEEDLFAAKTYLAEERLNKAALILEKGDHNKLDLSHAEKSHSVDKSENNITLFSAPPIKTQSNNISMPPPTETNYAPETVGIKAIVGGVDDRLSVLIRKGTKLPTSNSSLFFTSSENQTTMSIETYRGEDAQASKNLRSGKILVNDLPLLPKGKASVKVSFKLDINNVLTVTVLSIATGNSMEANYYL